MSYCIRCRCFTYTDCFTAINTVLASASSLLLLPKFEAASALRHLPEATVFNGRPDLLHAPPAAGRAKS